jgi:multiple antibiotic resistance protein
MTYADTVKFLVAMVIMMNPLGSMSIFLQLTYRSSFAYQRKTALKSGLAIAIIMVITLWLGSQTLELLGITIASFRFAGGIILLLIGLSMLQSEESPVIYSLGDDAAAGQRESVAVVPLAIPLIVGPGSISTLIIASNDYPDLLQKTWLSFLCILLAFFMCIILYFAPHVQRLVGESVIKVITRIMGMIIMAIAAGMLASGLIGLIPALSSSP